jgi:hypothetical protein
VAVARLDGEPSSRQRLPGPIYRWSRLNFQGHWARDDYLVCEVEEQALVTSTGQDDQRGGIQDPPLSHR